MQPQKTILPIHSMVKGGVLAVSSLPPLVKSLSLVLSLKYFVEVLFTQLLIIDFDHFKRETHQEPIWYLESGCSRSMTGVKSKFDAKADDGYFLGYSFVSKAFRVFNTRRQQIEETFHVTFDDCMEAIRFSNTSVDEIRINVMRRVAPPKFYNPPRQST
ncbi:hypothetical protein Tco_0184854 [Tanacetum coccineum]